MTTTSNLLFIEQICLKEFRFFILRHRRYFITFLAIYFYSLFSWKRTRLLRAAHCLAQHIDDVLDGDRDVNMPPLEYVDNLLSQIETKNYDSSVPISALACFVFHEADSRRKPGNDLSAELLKLFHALKKDRQRMDSKLVMPRAELLEHHHRTFTHSINASLMMVDSTLRVDDAPEMVDALSWVSPMRDLREDLGRGLINVPLEILELARQAGVSSLEYDALLQVPAVQQWIREEFVHAQDKMRMIPNRLLKLWPKRGALEIWAFYMEIQRYAVRYARKHRTILQTQN